jgi:signal transduction histidine kinase/ligand-binding sensor domain-containing protein
VDHSLQRVRLREQSATCRSSIARLQNSLSLYLQVGCKIQVVARAMRHRSHTENLLGYLFAIAVLISPEVANALPTELKISQYGHSSWRIEDGSFAEPQALAQTKDGYLWIGTASGLVRFDGVRFVPWPGPRSKAAKETSTSAAFGAADGSLWFGTPGQISQLKNGKLRVFDVRGRVEAITEADGTIWFARARLNKQQGPFCRIAGERIECTADPHIPFAYTMAIAPGSHGDLWLGSSAGLCHWQPQSLPSCILPPQLQGSHSEGVNAIIPDADGSIWVGNGHAGSGLGLAHLMDGMPIVPIAVGLSAEDLLVSTLLRDRDGAIWVGTHNQGIYRIANGRAEHYGRSEGLTDDSVNALLEDREGNIWVATNRGLDQFRTLRVTSYSKTEGLSGTAPATVVPAKDGSIWVSNYDSLDHIVGSDRDVNAVNTSGKRVTAMLEDHSGTIWAAIGSSLNVVINESLHMDQPDALGAGNFAISLSEDTKGDIWAVLRGKTNSVVRLHGGKIVEELGQDARRPESVAADPRRGVWIGYSNGCIAYRLDERPTSFCDEGNHSNAVNNLTVSSDGLVFGSTSDGLAIVWHGLRRRLSSMQGLPCDAIWGAVRDGYGMLWLNSNCGLIGISSGDLDRWLASPGLKLDYELLDWRDGAHTGPSDYSPKVALAPDGRAWFATGSSVEVIEPRSKFKADPFPVQIEDVLVDGTSLPLNIPSFPTRPKELQIEYTALHFGMSRRIAFQYMLEGHESEWKNVGPRRQAFYSALPAGAYRFRVRATDGDGQWREAETPFAFDVAPAYYETWWFRGFVVAVLLATLWLLYSLRLRQVSARLSDRHRAQLAERERIARDLHDTLLQGLLSASLQLAVANDQIAPDATAKPLVERTFQLLRQMIDEARDAVRGLRIQPSDPNDLERAFSQIPLDLAADKHIEYRLTVEGTPRSLHPLIQDDVYRIGREALANAFRHSHASIIELVLDYARDGLHLVIRDNGCGMDPEVLRSGRAGHWGLSGMRERSGKIGARLSIMSAVGAGTEVDLIMPAIAAYEPSTSSRWMDWLSGVFSRREQE